MNSVIFRHIWSHCHSIKIGRSTKKHWRQLRLERFDITGPFFSLLLFWLQCHPIHQVSWCLLNVQISTLHIKATWLKCEKPRVCIIAVILTWMTQNHRAAFSKQDCCQIPRPNCFILLTLWSSCLLATQQYMLTTQLKAFLPSGTALVISLWPLREFVQKVRSDHKQRQAFWHASWKNWERNYSIRTVTKMHTGFNVTIMNQLENEQCFFSSK